MKALLVEPSVKSIASNMALMRIARICEERGQEYRYVHGLVNPDKIELVPDKIYTSCIFSYNSAKYEATFKYYQKLYPEAEIIAGGGFPTVRPKWFLERNVTPYQGLNEDMENLIPKYNVPILWEKDKEKYKRNKIILYSSKGCVNKCGYCVIPRLEGGMRSYPSISKTLEMAKKELPEATSIVLYDNNLTEHVYFDNIIDELKDFGMPIDVFGLHVDSFTEHHAKRFSELQWASQNDQGTPYLRFSYDKVAYAAGVENALKLVCRYGIKAQFFCYLLYNFTDSPDDFWDRLIVAQQIRDRVEKDTGINKTLYLFPQKYIPLNALTKNKYVAENRGWTSEQLHGLARLYTYIHGFLSITKSRNLFNWIGHTKEEFFANIQHMHINKSIEKQEGKLILEGDEHGESTQSI